MALRFRAWRRPKDELKPINLLLPNLATMAQHTTQAGQPKISCFGKLVELWKRSLPTRPEARSWQTPEIKRPLRYQLLMIRGLPNTGAVGQIKLAMNT